MGASSPSGPEPTHCRGFTIILRHTKFDRPSLDEWSARCRNLYLTTHTHTTLTRDRLPCPPPTPGIGTQNPSKRAATEPVLRRAATGTFQTQIFVSVIQYEMSLCVLQFSGVKLFIYFILIRLVVSGSINKHTNKQKNCVLHCTFVMKVPECDCNETNCVAHCCIEALMCCAWLPSWVG